MHAYKHTAVRMPKLLTEAYIIIQSCINILYMHTYIHTSIQRLGCRSYFGANSLTVNTEAYISMQTYISIHTCMHTYIQACSSDAKVTLALTVFAVNTEAYISMQTYISIHTRMHTYIHAGIQAYCCSDAKVILTLTISQ